MARLALYAGLAVLAVVVVMFLTASFRSRPRRAGSQEPRDVMVLDPVCSTYLPKSRAVTRRVGKADLYFCSEACAERFTADHHEAHTR